MKQTPNGQAGFTLIELVMVIVILGVLAATAIPKFVDMKADAQAAAIKGVAGAAEAASTINYSSCSMVGNVVTANKCVKVAACDDAKSLLSSGAWPTGYSVTGAGSVTNGATSTCVLTLSGYTPTTSFNIISAGN